MHITENDSITWFESYLEPASSQIYKATSKAIISEEEAARIINDDLNKNLSKTTVKQYIIDTPPLRNLTFAISEAYDAWLEYDINAFSGEIVSKRDCSRWRPCIELEIRRDRNKKN
jgi:hypothetical protein